MKKEKWTNKINMFSNVIVYLICTPTLKCYTMLTF